jgi:hypothetical protein
MPQPIVSRFLALTRELKARVDTPQSSVKSADDVAQAKANPPTPPTVAEVADKLIERFDQNADNALTATELSAVLNPKAKFAVVDKMMANLVSRVDSSKDGSVSEAEWVSALEGLDRNDDGLLSRADLHHGPGALIALVGCLPDHEPPPAA